MADIKLVVNGLEFSGWTRACVTIGCDAIAGSFELSVTDRWNGSPTGNQLWPINEEDECKITVDGVTLIDGWVDERSVSYSADSRTLSVSGRDRAGVLVDCTAVLKTFSFKNLSILDVVQKIAEPFGIRVTLDPSVDSKPVTLTSKKHAGSVTGAGSSGKRTGLKVPKPARKFCIDPGETAWNAIDKACRLAGVLCVSDRQGGLLITRTGSATALIDLVEGRNILSASAKYNASGRYYRYLVRGQQPASDFIPGSQAAAVSAEAIDGNVKRIDRVLMIRPESAVTLESAKMRAAWEMKTRLARGNEVTIMVQGWTQGDGLPLWPVNATVAVDSPMLGIRGRMLITEVRLSVDDSAGETAELTLKNPDAFLPEPVATEASQAWKEIKNGVNTKATLGAVK